MKKYLLMLVLSFSCVLAQAKVIGVATGDNGDQVLFHDDLGQTCQPGTLRASYVYVKTYVHVGGCAYLLGTDLHVKFDDGDSRVVPVSAVKEPKEV